MHTHRPGDCGLDSESRVAPARCRLHGGRGAGGRGGRTSSASATSVPSAGKKAPWAAQTNHVCQVPGQLCAVEDEHEVCSVRGVRFSFHRRAADVRRAVRGYAG
eukprot:2871493-Prymnesium_polylepis.1